MIAVSIMSLFPRNVMPCHVIYFTSYFIVSYRSPTSIPVSPPSTTRGGKEREPGIEIDRSCHIMSEHDVSRRAASSYAIAMSFLCYATSFHCSIDIV